MRRGLIVFAAGLASALAFAPFHFFPVLLVTFPLLLVQTRGLTGFRAFGWGWLFGFGFFLAGLYWVTNALFVDIARFWWALPLALCALPMGLAVFCGLALWIASLREGVTRVLLFAFAWALMEFLRGHVFTGFPWNLVGYSWNGVLPVMQVSSVIGIYGLSLFTAFLAVSPLLPKKAIAALLIVLAATTGWGFSRLETHPTENTQTIVRLVQPNVSQKIKIDANALQERFDAVIEGTNLPGRFDVILWPETAMPYLFDDEDGWRFVRQRIGSEALLLAGVVRREIPDGRYFNSLMAVDAKGDIEALYDKAHLVPFGEYIPFSQYLPFDPLGGSFSTGPGPSTLHAAGVPPFSPLICYEGIFPNAVVNEKDRPDWLINITNDGWYGLSTGPYQHFEISRVRAVEEGLPLARAANTGVSGMVDAYGRIVAKSSLGKQAVMDILLPKSAPPTPYSRFGDIPFLAFLLLGLGALFLKRR